MGCSRREFLVGAAGALPLGSLAHAAQGRRPKIAALTTIYHKYSHSQHIVDRFLEGYGWEGRHHRPPMDVVSLYVEQIGENDWSRERVKRHSQLKSYPTIAEALTLGGNKLAVDGVLLIGEHGDFPNNEKGQKLYPRYEYFEQVMDVYRDSGRTAPLFNDKHLSWNWKWAKKMVETSEEMGFGFMAGSSLPVARRLPSIDLPWGADVEEAVGVWAGGIDGGDIHVIEAMQSIVERRRGGVSDMDVLRVASVLHPTPAVAGTPTQDALDWLHDNEELDRGWYAAPVGWCDLDGNGELRVALRSALVDSDRVQLIAGAGIVADSVPEDELAETAVKLRALLDVMEI